MEPAVPGLRVVVPDVTDTLQMTDCLLRSLELLQAHMTEEVPQVVWEAVPELGGHTALTCLGAYLSRASSCRPSVA